MFKWYKRKRNWWILIGISIIGMLIGIYQSAKIDREIERSKKMYVCRQGGAIFSQTIKYIDDEEEVSNYLQRVKGFDVKAAGKGYGGGMLENGQLVYVLAYSTDSALVKVRIKNEKVTPVKPLYENHWIYYEFLSESQCR